MSDRHLSLHRNKSPQEPTRGRATTKHTRVEFLSRPGTTNRHRNLWNSSSSPRSSAKWIDSPVKVPLPSNNGDEYEQWKEVMEAEAEAEAQTEMLKADSNKLDDDTERPSTPPDGEEEFTDDDETTYKWDRGLRAWVPQESENAITTSEYDVEKMTFEKEEELFPTFDDAIVKENVSVSSEVAEPVRDAKRKSPEKPADDKPVDEKPADKMGDVLIIANVGDSRAVMAVTCADGNLEPIKLTVDCKMGCTGSG